MRSTSPAVYHGAAANPQRTPEETIGTVLPPHLNCTIRRPLGQRPTPSTVVPSRSSPATARPGGGKGQRSSTSLPRTFSAESCWEGERVGGENCLRVRYVYLVGHFVVDSCVQAHAARTDPLPFCVRACANVNVPSHGTPEVAFLVRSLSATHGRLEQQHDRWRDDQRLELPSLSHTHPVDVSLCLLVDRSGRVSAQTALPCWRSVRLSRSLVVCLTASSSACLPVSLCVCACVSLSIMSSPYPCLCHHPAL